MTPFVIRQLGPSDEAALTLLAQEETDFTGEEPSPPLTPEQARAYLQDPNVWHWHAETEGQTIGFLTAQMQRGRHGAARVVFFDEIGVREAWRRHGVGRALVAALHQKMQQEDISVVWVLADNSGAQAFYQACGYTVSDLQGVMLVRETSA